MIDKIGLKQCFHLRSGEIIRVNSVHAKTVQCDMFDNELKRWVPLRIPMPTWSIYAPCADPSKTVTTDMTATGWWRRRLFSSQNLAN